MRSTSCVAWAVTLSLALGACSKSAGGDASSTPDAGRDAGRSTDGGMREIDGGMRETDGGMREIDGGVEEDAGIPDSGTADGGGQTTMDGGVPPLALDTLSDLFEAAWCDRSVECGLATSRAHCLQQFRGAKSTFGSTQALVASAQAGKASVDLASTQSCLDGLASAPCDTVLQTANFELFCPQAVTGHLGAGARCISPGACGAGFDCSPKSSGSDPCEGTCVALGQGTCRTFTDCGSGKVCSAGVCVAQAPAGGKGQACGSPTRCLPGLVCATGGSSPVCTAIPVSGQSCQDVLVCSGVGITCALSDDLLSTKCLPIRHEGEICSQSSQCDGPYEMYCDRVCKVLPTSGPCQAVGFFYQCESAAAWCDLGSGQPMCHAFSPPGANCSTRAECGLAAGLGDCINDKCVASIGATCAP